MNIIVSHDIDHITAWEHKRDLIIPKFVVRALIELFLGYINWSEVKQRIKSIADNKWNNVTELMNFDREMGVSSTFFLGVRTGRYIEYSSEDSQALIKKIQQHGFDVGVHGIAYEDLNKMKQEYEDFKVMSGLSEFGIRMHYLLTSHNTLDLLSKIGYTFDSTTTEIRNPYKIGNLWEFPLHIMDGNIIYYKRCYQSRNLEQAKKATIELMENAQRAKISYFSLLFHDDYFCDAFQTWKDWYIWFIHFCNENKFEFMNFFKAIKELES